VSLSLKEIQELGKRIDATADLWRDAIDAHDQAPPDHNFASRLRKTAEAAHLQAAALDTAVSGGVISKRHDELRHFPRELSPDANRPGPVELWATWDAAVAAWQRAAQGTSVPEVASATRRIGDIADELASVINQERKTGSDSQLARRTASQ
jgi:hypothetical protein